jgi:SAM-dependent methyltransferase
MFNFTLLKNKVVKKGAKRMYKLRYAFWEALLRAGRHTPSEDTLNQTQRWFCEWNAERLGIPIEESKQRYFHSLAAIAGGPRGIRFHLFNELSYDIFRPFADDSHGEITEAYRFHACLHFLMMLGYEEPVWDTQDPIVQGLPTEGPVAILDYGCGLAQASRGLAMLLRDRGQQVSLTLVDFPTIRKPFLAWMGERMGIAVSNLDVTPEDPIPELPDCHVCFATEVFEHMHDPLPAFERIDKSLVSGGFLLTDVADHRDEFMHVSPNLAALRDRLTDFGYTALRRNRVFRKSAG